MLQTALNPFQKLTKTHLRFELGQRGKGAGRLSLLTTAIGRFKLSYTTATHELFGNGQIGADAIWIPLEPIADEFASHDSDTKLFALCGTTCFVTHIIYFVLTIHISIIDNSTLAMPTEPTKPQSYSVSAIASALLSQITGFRIDIILDKGFQNHNGKGLYFFSLLLLLMKGLRL
jgi:hypothetical protein